jgi:general stress protein YciG
MGGTKAGGLQTATTIKAKYGDDFYVRIGRLGGAVGTTGGFFANRELASEAGRKGGKISRRPKRKEVLDGQDLHR